MKSFAMDHHFDNIPVARYLVGVLKFIGHWRHTATPVEGCSLRQVLRRGHRYLLHLPLSILLIILLWVKAFASRDLAEAGEIVYMSLIVSAMGVKVINLWLLDAKAERFIAEVATSDTYTLRSEKERRLWRREQRRFGLTSAVYIGGSLASFFQAFGVVLIGFTYKLPFEMWTPIDPEPHLNFWIIYGYEAAAMCLCCLSNATVDMMYCYFMFHVALLYKVIAWRLQALSGLPEECVTAELKQIFRLHENVKHLTAECQTLVSVPILAQIVLSAYILCFCGYLLTKIRFSENPEQFALMAGIMSLMITQIFLPCYYGNTITVNANALTNSIYNTDWPQWPVAFRKLIYVYMEFQKRPVQIRAGFFFELGLPMFTKTINNAYSLFAVLLTMDK